MSNLNETFTALVQEGVRAIQGISDPKDKATACAELASAVASTGLIVLTGNVDLETAETVEEAKEAIKKGDSGKTKSKKTKTKPKPAPKKKKEEPVEEEVVEEEIIEEEEEVVEEVESAEWTDAAKEKYAKELKEIAEIAEDFGSETIDECVVTFSEGHYDNYDDITPLNIIGFHTFLKELLKEAGEE